MKPSKTKAEQPDDINLEGMDVTDRSKVATKLMGRRKYKEVQIETFESNKNQEGNHSAVTEESAEKESRGEDGNENIGAASGGCDIQEVISKTTQEILKRSSGSFSSNKDEAELSEILQRSSSMPPMAPSSSSGKKTPSRVFSNPSRQLASPSLSTTSKSYFSGNPAVQITHGIIQLYKTNYMVNYDEGSRPPPTKMLCMLCVPASVDAHSILEFTSGFCDTIKRLHIIRDRTPNQYMVLMLFSSKKAAASFYFTFNGVPFSTLVEEDVCHLAFVASVEALPSMHSSMEKDATGLMPIIHSTELPDCVLCLERMDESVRGVLTILCNHSFHGSCLQKWEDLCCPVCRYLQTPEPQSDNRCLVCGSVEDLWICLICGNVGCGRYTHECAKQHYMDTHHNYAMALKDNRVWDYAGDYFVHRLFQNKEDGKLVEHKSSDDGLEERESKIEAIQLECMYLLTSQLDSQRKHWEERLAKVEEIAAADRNSADVQMAESLRKLEMLEKDRTALEKKNQHLSSKYSSSLRELSTETELNNGLRKNQEEWRAKVTSLEVLTKSQQTEIQDLKEQVRDLMFFLEAQKTVDGAEQDVKEDIQKFWKCEFCINSMKLLRKTTFFFLIFAVLLFILVVPNVDIAEYFSTLKGDELIIYNKVPKCGSSALLSLANYLSQKRNRFLIHQHPPVMQAINFEKRITEENGFNVVTVISSLKRPALFAKHLYYINFTKFGREKPIYINMVRDPVERFVSHFYFDQFGSHGLNISGPISHLNINECVLNEYRRCTSEYYLSLFMTRFFCGNEDECASNNEMAAVAKAKEIIRNDFLVIGLTEEFENSLLLFEKMLPKFFHGALEEWKWIKEDRMYQYSTVHKDELTPKARKILRDRMWADNELYQFIKSRFQLLKRAYGITRRRNQ